MKIAVDISPIDAGSTSGHKVRGVGRYIELLQSCLPQYDKKNEYIFTSDTRKKKIDADVIHYPYFDPFFLTLPLRNRLPTIVTVHDLIPIVHAKNFPVGLRGAAKWKMNKFLLRRIGKIITDSHASSVDIVRYVGVEKKRVKTVYLAVDERYRQVEPSQKDEDLLRDKYSLPPNFFLYVGDVTWNKNLPRLLEAVKKAEVPLVLVGKSLAEVRFDAANAWNSDRVIAQRMISENKNVSALGFVSDDDLIMLYNLADALIMPSLDEGFGLPVLEAMSCGCPVITSREGSLPEVGGKAVQYVDARSVDSIAHGISVLASSKKHREVLSNAGLNQAKKFSQEKMVSDIVKVYQSNI